MYDELVERLRKEANFPYNDNRNLMAQSADAIEELSLTAESYKRSMEAWADEAVNAQSRWIPVTERLPESGVCVLVTDGREVGEGWLTEITNTRGHFMRWCCPTADIDVDRRHITHWMVMPKAPMEGE